MGHSRKIIGWSLQPSLRAEGPIEALKMALSSIPRRIRVNAPTRLIHHSDRGIQRSTSDIAVESL